LGDVLIDDSIHNLLDGNYLKILFDHPNNHNYDARANQMHRVYTLAQAYEIITKELLPC
jgi:5'(3')-deoxyribonucleotidase